MIAAQGHHLFTVGRTPVYMHTSFLWMMGIIAVWHLAGGATGGEVFAVILAIFLSLLVHEFGHVLAAATNGHDSVVMLWGMGGLTWSKGESRGWRQVWLSVAGPLAGFVLWGILWFGLMPGDGDHLKLDWRAMLVPWIAVDEEFVGTRTLYHGFWAFLCFINLLWGLFNLLPVPPLDGGHIADELCRMWLPPSRARRVAATLAIVVALAAIVFGLMFKFYILAMFMGLMAWQQYQRLQHG